MISLNEFVSETTNEVWRSGYDVNRLNNDDLERDFYKGFEPEQSAQRARNCQQAERDYYREQQEQQEIDDYHEMRRLEFEQQEYENNLAVEAYNQQLQEEWEAFQLEELNQQIMDNGIDYETYMNLHLWL